MRKKGGFAMVGASAHKIMNTLINPNKEDAEELEATQNLLKLLYYTDKDSYKDPTEEADLNLEMIRSNITPSGDRITVIPKLPNPDEEERCKIVILFDDFDVSDNNKMIANTIRIDVVVPLDYWLTGSPIGRALRVFLMMDEISFLINGKSFEGLGLLRLEGADSIALSPSMVGYSMHFSNYDFNA